MMLRANDLHFIIAGYEMAMHRLQRALRGRLHPSKRREYQQRVIDLRAKIEEHRVECDEYEFRARCAVSEYA